MKKVLLLFSVVAVFGFTSCEECHECHYDMNGSEIELGEFCDDELEEIEKAGFTDTDGTVYEVHCHEH